ncbi:MAG: tRNA pseudouridine(38-40) synthase TruA [Candidatus Eisenbacteria bacterium]
MNEGTASDPSAPGTRTLRVLVAYDGSGYHGWQVQPGLPTVQGEIESALSRITGQRTRVHGAGRTDTGVHALGQVASFTLTTRIPDDRLASALNAHLPPEIRVGAVEPSPTRSTRASAHWRCYGYLLVREPSPFLSRYAFRSRPWPDPDPMNAACAELTGERDFRAFTSQPEGPFGCFLFGARWRAWSDGLVFEVRANRFLHRMVRFLVGTCLEIGRGNRPVEEMANLLESGDRRRTPAPAPSTGLYLLEVGYEEPWTGRSSASLAGPIPRVFPASD